MRGLRITAHLSTPVATLSQDGRVHLDSVLAYAVMRPIEHTLPPSRQSVQVIEIPALKCLWRDEAGRPLWACSDLIPVSPAMQSIEYGHRRYPADRAHLSKKPSANTAAGQFKEGRRQMLVTSAPVWEAVAIGKRDDVQALLDTISHIGGRSVNYGRVIRWEVTIDDAVTERDVINRRSVPEAAGLEHSGKLNSFCGWTPPYWYHPWYTACMEPEQCSYQN